MFDRAHSSFARFIKIKSPRRMRNRNLKQHDEQRSTAKGAHCI